MIYYIADMHFGHKNVLRFDTRPFSSVEEMDGELIRRWNERVKPDDTVYVLGDAFWRNEAESLRIFSELNGHKHLIRGNHDRVHGKLGRQWESIEHYAEINDNGRLVVLCHYPIMFYKNARYGAVMLYGHVHNSKEWMITENWKNSLCEDGIPCNMINVGCMMSYMDYTPRTLEELLAAAPFRESGDDQMNNDRNILKELQEAFSGLLDLRDKAYDLYSEAVDAVERGLIPEEKQVEEILDGLLEYCDEERFFRLYQKLCRLVYERYPALVGEFVNMFRMIFETKDHDDARTDQ